MENVTAVAGRVDEEQIFTFSYRHRQQTSLSKSSIGKR